MRMPNYHNIVKRLRRRDQRGAAMVEFAIALPILVVLLAIVFDAGLGFNSARTSSSAARSAARVGALAGDDRLADFRVLDALRSQFTSDQEVDRIIIYRSDSTNGDGLPPAPGSCTNPVSKCNEYLGAVLDTLNQADFIGLENAGTPTETCASTSLDSNWCPLGRQDDADAFLGVYVESTSKPTIGAVSPDSFTLKDRAVFAFFFAPTPVPLAGP